MASIVLGIGAVVSIQSFSENLKSNIELQSKSLMGADYIIDSRHQANEKVQRIIDSLGGADAREINFASMGLFPKNGGTKLIQVKGLEGDFPFYGNFETTPATAADTFQEKGAALVDATLMLQFKIEPGDSIKIGNVTHRLKIGVAQGGVGAGTANIGVQGGTATLNLCAGNVLSEVGGHQRRAHPTEVDTGDSVFVDGADTAGR